MHPVARILTAVAAVAPIAALSIHSICDLAFDCGCAPMWAGGAEHCNIHDPAPPDCPWCTGQTFYAVAALALAGIGIGAFAGARYSERILPPILGALGGYAVAVWIGTFLA